MTTGHPVPGRVKLTQAKVGKDTWHSTVDGRFTIRPTEWAPGNPHRPTSYDVSDANNPAARYGASRLSEGRELIASILDAESRIASRATGVPMNDRPEGAADDANVWADPYGDKPVPVGRDVTLWFGDYGTNEPGFEVRYRDGALRVTGDNLGAGDVVVVPTGGNQFVIDIVNRRKGQS